MSIVCPLPSCYLIIVPVASAVSPSLPSLYSLLVSAVLCWSVVFRVSYVVSVSCWLCSSLMPACLFFPFGVVFVLLCFILLLKETILCIWVLDLISRDRTDQPRWGLSRGGVWAAHHPTLSPAPYTNASSSTRPWAALPSAGQWREEFCRGVQWCSWGARLQWWGPQGPFQQRPWWAPQLVEDEWAGPPHIWGIRRGFGTFPS